jgi:hypothetical protein
MKHVELHTLIPHPAIFNCALQKEHTSKTRCLIIYDTLFTRLFRYLTGVTMASILLPSIIFDCWTTRGVGQICSNELHNLHSSPNIIQRKRKRGHLEGLGVDGRIIKMGLKEICSDGVGWLNTVLSLLVP